jgi:restriction endonuclease
MTSSASRRAVIAAKKPVTHRKIDLETLEMIVKELIKAFSVTTRLAQHSVVDILGKIKVDVLDEVQAKVENLQGLEDIDTVRVVVAVEETLKAIAATTSLDTDVISQILTEIKGASVENIALRLHLKSCASVANNLAITQTQVTD